MPYQALFDALNDLAMGAPAPSWAAAKALAHSSTCRLLGRPRLRRPVVTCSRLHSSEAPDDVVVVGAGAAGLTAAFFAASAGASVTVLERTGEAGKKILMSGGTRCNVLPMAVDVSTDFQTRGSQNAMKAVFRTWSLDGCHAWLEKDVGLELAAEVETSKWFPASNSGRDVRDRLLSACERRGVTVAYNASVEGLRRSDDGGCFELDIAAREPRGSRLAGSRGVAGSGEPHPARVVRASRVVFASGGLSFPAVGTDGTGHRLLDGLGLTMTPTYPALTPLTGAHPHQEPLPGVTVPAVALSVRLGPKRKDARQAHRGGFLFTHKGFSGPSVLDLSHHLVTAMEQGGSPPPLVASWTGDDEDAWMRRFGESASAQVRNIIARHMPQRLAQALCDEAGMPADRKAGELRKEERVRLLAMLTQYPLHVTGHQGYPKAEVTGGGVALSEVDAGTLECKRHRGLYLCGEVLDVFGRIGGFNFFWAWVSGRAAGLAAGRAAAEARGAGS